MTPTARHAFLMLLALRDLEERDRRPPPPPRELLDRLPLLVAPDPKPDPRERGKTPYKSRVEGTPPVWNGKRR